MPGGARIPPPSVCGEPPSSVFQTDVQGPRGRRGVVFAERGVVFQPGYVEADLGLSPADAGCVPAKEPADDQTVPRVSLAPTTSWRVAPRPGSRSRVPWGQKQTREKTPSIAPPQFSHIMRLTFLSTHSPVRTKVAFLFLPFLHFALLAPRLPTRQPAARIQQSRSDQSPDRRTGDDRSCLPYGVPRVRARTNHDRKRLLLRSASPPRGRVVWPLRRLVR